MKIVKKIISIFLVIMLFPFSVSVSALSIGSKIIVGKIITNEQLDISNIKIDIYNSILVNEADGV